MSADVTHIGVLGLGLMGSSLYLAIKKHYPAATIHVWNHNHNAKVAHFAKKHNLTVSDDLINTVRSCQQLIFATPITNILPILQDIVAYDSTLIKGKYITEITSVKGTLFQQIATFITLHQGLFYGSHPMTGSHKSDPNHGSAELFNNKYCFLVTTDKSNLTNSAAQNWQLFWQKIGCITVPTITCSEHDQITATISHYPHLMAAITACHSLKNTSINPYIGSGGKDTTRVAAGNSVMWQDIIWYNKKQLLPLLLDTQRDIAQLIKILSLDTENAPLQLAEYLKTAQQLRQTID